MNLQGKEDKEHPGSPVTINGIVTTARVGNARGVRSSHFGTIIARREVVSNVRPPACFEQTISLLPRPSRVASGYPIVGQPLRV